MTYKAIMVHVGVDPESPRRVKAALALGARFGSTIVGVGACAWDPYIDPGMGFVDGETIQILRDAVDADIAAGETAFRTASAAYAHPVEWRSVVGYPAEEMAALSRSVDLIVASQYQKGFDARRLPAAADLVMMSGLPVIVVPPEQDNAQPGTVLIGWKNTRETRRAISDALPMLRIAEHVHIARIAEDDDKGTEAAELQDVVDRLARHGIEAEACTVPRLKLDVATELMAVAESRGADLVVLGAYGHSRAREWTFGGVTADLFAGAPKRILFSH